MNLTRGVLISGLSLLLCIEVSAETGAADFAGIARRNVFRLNPPPHPEPYPQQIEPLRPLVSLHGLTTLPGSAEALLGIQVKAMPGQTEVCCRLGEGQTEAGVFVRRIDMDSATVWIVNSGVEQVLSLRD
jgi:hypothetical protein